MPAAIPCRGNSSLLGRGGTHDPQILRVPRALRADAADGSPDLKTTVTSNGVSVRRTSPAEGAAALQGKTFKCTQCGKCCTMLDDAEVWVMPDEVQRLAAHLELSVDAFKQRHTQPADLSGWRMLAAKPAGPASRLQGQVCTFLDPDSLQCTVHAVRPLQCSTFPFWPELMHPRVWTHVKETLCEGLDHAEAGPLDLPDALQQLSAATEQVLQLDAVKPTSWAQDHCHDA